MTLDEFRAMPRISSYLPLTFLPGKQQFTGFVLECGECKEDIDDSRGYVTPEGVCNDYRSLPIILSYRVMAYGVCCNKLTTANYTFHEDMTVSSGESIWGMRKLTLWERCVYYTRNSFFKNFKFTA